MIEHPIKRLNGKDAALIRTLIMRYGFDGLVHELFMISTSYAQQKLTWKPIASRLKAACYFIRRAEGKAPPLRSQS